MHIGIFTNNYLPNPYGISTSIEGFRKGLEKQGHKVSIFAPEWVGEVQEDLPNVYRYSAVKAPTKLPFSLAFPYDPKMHKQIKNMKFDLIHAQHPNLVGAQGKRWAKEKNIPLIYTWHSIYDKYTHYVYPIPHKFAAKWIIDNALNFADSADRVIVPTNSMLENIKSKGFSHKNVHIVPSGVDEELFSHPNGQDVRGKYNIPNNVTLISSISRLTQEKNVCFLAGVMKKVLLQNKNAYFLFGGEGDLSDKVREILNDDLIKDRVIFTGKIERESVKDYLDSSDIFVYASTTETQGTIISEAMYMGIPIVAIDSSGVRDMVIDGETGYLTAHSVNDMTYTISKCIKNTSDRERLSREALKYARQNYTVTACTNKLLDVYNQAIFERNQ